MNLHLTWSSGDIIRLNSKSSDLNSLDQMLAIFFSAELWFLIKNKVSQHQLIYDNKIKYIMIGWNTNFEKVLSSQDTNRLWGQH